MWIGLPIMKSGRHPDRALTTVRVNSVKKPGKLADGNGLYLVIDPSGAKRWLLRTVVQGRRRDIGLGSVRLVSLGEAREAARSYRKIAREGGNPLTERRRAQIAVAPNFDDLARTVHQQHKAGWKNAKHGAQWMSTLKKYAFPALGGLPVDQIGTPDILRALAPVWLAKPETARRVRQRIGTVLDYAKAAGYRIDGNPVEGVAKALPRQPDRNSHHSAMSYDQVAGFVQKLQAETSVGAALALEFLILTAARTGEVLGAKWCEINFEQASWTIPDNRMKAGREHRVPLSPRALAILLQAKALSALSEFVFPGRSATNPMSNMAFLMLMRRMNIDLTVHGFRSSFRDWSSERTNFSREICEAALAHAVKDRTEAAYRRGDLFEKRRELMISWSNFVSSADKVTSIRLVS